jgi:RNA polymerase sigma-70 factor, ECF subfamily
MPLRLAQLFRKKHADDQADDLQCWRRIRAGGKEREEACAELYVRYGPTLKSLFGGEGMDMFSVQDLAHDVMIKVITKSHQYYQNEPFRVWLLRIANHSLQDWRKKNANRDLLMEQNMADRTSPLHLIAAPPCPPDQTELRNCIEQHFAKYEAIDPRGATIIKLAALENLRDKEIASVMDMSNDSLRQYKSKARKALQQLLAYCRDLLGEKA